MTPCAAPVTAASSRCTRAHPRLHSRRKPFGLRAGRHDERAGDESVCLAVSMVAQGSDVLARPRVRRAMEVVTGTVLVALGVRLATEPH